ncbi:MAG: hypothetical protein LBO75_02995 [Bifidobacteriaceae bacterium]|jgi:hypothetical protein|nr:hypothetical protein [Bifidobacteriaceae bacterium]
MSGRAEFRRGFFDELDRVGAWLRTEVEPDAAVRFLDDVDVIIGRIEDSPLSYRVDERFGARRAHIGR